MSRVSNHVDDRRDPEFGGFQPLAILSKHGQERSDALSLEEIYEQREHRVHAPRISSADQIGNRIHDNHAGPELAYFLVHRNEVHFQAMEEWTLRDNPQPPAVQVGLEIDPDRFHVAGNLVG